MTNEQAIKILNTVLSFGKCDCPREEIEECLKMAIKALKRTSWISCSERLPEDDDTCYHVTAWMPLPEEYKAESEDKK